MVSRAMMSFFTRALHCLLYVHLCRRVKKTFIVIAIEKGEAGNDNFMLTYMHDVQYMWICVDAMVGMGEDES